MLPAQFTVAENSDYTSAKVASARVTLMLNLRSVVKNLPTLAQSIDGGQSKLLHFLQRVCKSVLSFNHSLILS